MSGFPFFIGGGEPPSEEEIERMRLAHDRQHMEQEALTLEMDNWIENMSGRDLWLLTQVMRGCYDDVPWTSARIGFIQGMMKYKHGFDPNTGMPASVGIPTENDGDESA